MPVTQVYIEVWMVAVVSVVFALKQKKEAEGPERIYMSPVQRSTLMILTAIGALWYQPSYTCPKLPCPSLVTNVGLILSQHNCTAKGQKNGTYAFRSVYVHGRCMTKCCPLVCELWIANANLGSVSQGLDNCIVT